MFKPKSISSVISVLTAFLVLSAAFGSAPLLAAGCLYYNRDRDGDGVVDDKDSYPDDPTRSSDADRMPSMRITFIPAAEVTEGPVDEFSIEEKSPVIIWVFQNEDIFGSIKKFVEKESAAPVTETLDANALRLKLEFPKDQTTYYADKAGVIAKDEAVTGALTPEEFQALEKSILALRGIVDMKENQNLCQELPVEQEARGDASPVIDGKPVLKIAMIPFASKEKAAVGLTDISEKAQITIAIFSNSDAVTEIRSVLQAEGSQTAFGSESIRFQAEFPGDGISIAVDKDGATSQNGTPQASLSPEDLKFLENQARHLRGVVDMRVQEKLCSLEG